MNLKCFYTCIVYNSLVFLQVTVSLDGTLVLHGGGDKKLIEERCEQVVMLYPLVSFYGIMKITVGVVHISFVLLCYTFEEPREDILSYISIRVNLSCCISKFLCGREFPVGISETESRFIDFLVNH